MTPLLHDPDRLAEIAELGLLDEAPDPALDALAAEAAAALDAPIGLVSVLLDEAQCFAGAHGLDGTWLAESRGTPVAWSFCRHALAAGAPFVVEDAADHPLVADSPITRLDGVRCYAGVPLVTSAGRTLGTVCVLGHEPRGFAAADLARLRAIADRVLELLEARR